MKIECGEVYVPCLIFSTHPDADYVSAIDVQEDSSLTRWIADENKSGTLKKLLYPGDSTAAMETNFRVQMQQLEARTLQMTIQPAAAASVTSLGRGRARGALQWSEDK